MMSKTGTERIKYITSVAFIGIVLVSGVIGGGKGDPKGVAYGLAAAVAFMCIVLCNRNLKDISAMERSIIQLSVSAVVSELIPQD